MLLEAEESQLVLVDYQERLMPAIHEGAAAVANALRLAQVARLLEVFDERVVAIPVREDGNHIVFAFRDPAFAPRWHWMRSQALALQGRLGLDFPGFAQQLEAGARQGHAQRLAR